MKKTHKYRLYPTKKQIAIIEDQLKEACCLYNAALQERRDAYKKLKISLSCYHQTYQLKDIRADGSTGLISFKVAQDVLLRLDRAFDSFFRRIKSGEKAGYPRFKSHKRYHSITYINYGNKPHVDNKNRLILKGIGHIKVKWHRPVIGITKTCTIKREAGRWYVYFCVDTETSPLPYNNNVVGIDVGLHSFATLDNGSSIGNPRFEKKALKQLRISRRRVSRRYQKSIKHQSHRYLKAVGMLQRVYTHIKQQRWYFHHTEARKLVNCYGIIAVEDIPIINLTRSSRGTKDKSSSNIQRKSGLNRSILDAGWGSFINILFAKAEEAERTSVKVPAPGTSQVCICGAGVPKRLKDRWHLCLTCGLSVPRDQASAMIIKQRALQQLSA